MRIFVADKTNRKMENQFVPYELAVKLKELGFNEPCICYFNKSENNQLWQDIGGGYYRNSVVSIGNLLWGETYDNGNVSAPLWQQAFDWFLNEKSHFSYIRIFNHYDFGFSIFKVDEDKSTKKELLFSSNYYTSYESARTACLEKLIELITNK